MDGLLQLLFRHGLNDDFFNDHRIAADGHGNIIFSDAAGFHELLNGFGDALRIVNRALFNGAVGNVNGAKIFERTAALGFYDFGCLYGSRADIQSDQVIFFSKNHERCLILKNFVFIRRFQSQCQKNLAFGIHAAWHAIFDSGNGDWRNMRLSGQFSLAHQHRFSCFF